MITREQLVEHARTCLFGPPRSGRTLGLELEFIMLRAGSHEVMPVAGAAGSLSWLRALGVSLGWSEGLTSAGAPAFMTAQGGALSFEPGGQLEYSTPVFNRANELLVDARAMAELLMRQACAEGIELLALGIDPHHDIAHAPLQLSTPRYANLARCFEENGEAGARMMRQTAAVQMSIGLGEQPERRWRMLNAMVPALTALFANSGRYAGGASGYASFRSRCWRALDPSRTGFFGGDSGPERYVDFGLAAKAVLDPHARSGFRPFAHWQKVATMEDWEAHLTTLFPEVRPKGFFELRCIDAQPPAGYGAIVALVTGVVEDPASLGDAECVLPSCTSDRLDRAGKHGLADVELRGVAEDLVSIGLSGCGRLGEDFMSAAELAAAESYLRLQLKMGPI